MMGSSGKKLEMSADQMDESHPQLRDYYYVLFFALIFPVVRLLLDVSVFQRLAAWLIYARDPRALKAFLKTADNRKLLKTTESMWKLSYYTTSELFALYATLGEPWFADNVLFWDQWPNQTMNFELKIFYTFQCGFYIYSVVALLVWETRRKDFGVMMSHHVITIGLIASSYITGCFRAGSLILALHDASDVLLESAKLMKYFGCDIGASILFGMFTLSWLVLRLIYFPLWMIWSSSIDVVRYVDLGVNKHVKLYYYFNTMLISLLVIHVYWWVLIWRMVMRQFQNHGQVGEDVRSDSEDD